jgi:signal transduction histidine kinase
MATIIFAVAYAALCIAITLARAPGSPRQRFRARVLPLALIVISLATFGLDAGAYTVPLVLVIVAGLLACVVPAVAAKLTSFALIGYGAFGIDYANSIVAPPVTFYGVLPVTQVLRETGFAFTSKAVSVVPAGKGITAFSGLPTPFIFALRSPIWTANLVPVEAVIFIVVGLWLLARADGPGSAQLRAFGNALRNRGPVPPSLLLPVIIAWIAVADGFHTAYLDWYVLTAAASVTTVSLAKRWAAYLAVLGLGLFALYGLLVAAVHDPAHIYGLIVVNSTAAGYLAGVQGLVLLVVTARLWPALSNKKVTQLTQRVERLTLSRSEATDTAITELKRIERDLHDGAQARLVAVGMSLRAAEQLMLTSPEAALALVSEARETSSRALTDLRDLVRGIYPPVLADRGLADALRSLALDAPLPVDVEIDLPDEVAMPRAAAVYFAAAEALANAVRHSGATRVRIQGLRTSLALRVEVTDDGGGGADAARGTGLAGVERRLATFDGILAVSSPVGGPTIVVIEVPCALSSAKISIS